MKNDDLEILERALAHNRRLLDELKTAQGFKPLTKSEQRRYFLLRVCVARGEMDLKLIKREDATKETEIYNRIKAADEAWERIQAAGRKASQ